MNLASFHETVSNTSFHGTSSGQTPLSAHAPTQQAVSQLQKEGWTGPAPTTTPPLCSTPRRLQQRARKWPLSHFPQSWGPRWGCQTLSPAQSFSPSPGPGAAPRGEPASCRSVHLAGLLWFSEDLGGLRDAKGHAVARGKELRSPTRSKPRASNQRPVQLQRKVSPDGERRPPGRGRWVGSEAGRSTLRDGTRVTWGG